MSIFRIAELSLPTEPLVLPLRRGMILDRPLENECFSAPSFDTRNSIPQFFAIRDGAVVFYL
jgi:hypothetical protein